MSGSYGIPGQISAPLIQDVCQRVLDASQRAGKVAGLHVCRPSQVAVTDAVNAGYAFIAIGVDTVFLDEAARSALGFAKSAVS
jgi:2-keto-3-deoxy-L-rhamnonate aldolase RhmA